MRGDEKMNKTAIIFSILVLGCSLQVQAKSGDAEAGKAKSATCAACHGEAGVSATPSFPSLAGQYSDYLYHALKDYKLGKRKNAIMAGQVQNLSDQDMADLAAYFSKLKGLSIKY
jgi:cytochrome c553